jgi:PTS system nitrogen regulatory IIA component
MQTLSNLLSPQHITLDLEVSSKKRLFEQAGLLFENLHDLPRVRVYDSLFARERLGSTGMGHGVAIPHGRISGLRHAVGALMRLRTPIAFEAPDGAPVSLAFVLMMPERATTMHLAILSQLAELLSDPSERERILAAPDAATIHTIFSTWQPHVTHQRSATR